MIKELFSDIYFLKILFGTMILGFSAGAIGVFTTLRKQALIGDALSHAALPGVVIAFMIFNTKSIEVLLLGALISSLVSMAIIELINKYTIIKFDALMALVLSSFFGFGNVLMSLVKGGSQAGLSKFIFGEAATMLNKDVLMISISSIILLIVSLSFWRHIKLFIFNSEFYESLGFNANLIRFLLTFLTVIVVVVSIRAIGVILMSALLIAPAISARMYSNKLSINFMIAGIIGAICGGVGTIFSFILSGVPTGPIIVLVLSLILIISLLISPKNGVLIYKIKQRKQKQLILKYHLLVHLYEYGSTNLEIDDVFISENLVSIVNGNYHLTNKGETLVINILRGENLWG